MEIKEVKKALEDMAGMEARTVKKALVAMEIRAARKIMPTMEIRVNKVAKWNKTGQVFMETGMIRTKRSDLSVYGRSQLITGRRSNAAA